MAESYIVRKGGGGVSKYSTWVVEDENSAKYKVHNGYDAWSNPTPDLTNLPFNQWLLNNSATGAIVLSNTILQNAGTFNGTNSIINEANIARQLRVSSNQLALGGRAINNISNTFFYATNLSGSHYILKAHLGNLATFGGTGQDYFGNIHNVAINNGFLYVGGAASGPRGVMKLNELDSSLVGNTPSYGSTINAIVTNNGFIYAGGGAEHVKRYNESTLAFVDQTTSFGAAVHIIAINNGFLYVAGGNPPGGTNRGFSKYHESNLTLVANTSNYGSPINSILINDGFIFIGGGANIQKYHESNLVFVSASPSATQIVSMATDKKGFIYTLDQGTQRIRKYYESNLAFVNNSAASIGRILNIITDGSYVFAGDGNNLEKYFQRTAGGDVQTYYAINKVKE